MGGCHKSPIGVAEGKAAIKQCQAVRICPVTNGLPTAMTEKSFKKLCKQAREQDRLAGALDNRAWKFTHCASCKGKQYPHELRIVPLAELERARKKRESREMQQHSPAR